MFCPLALRVWNVLLPGLRVEDTAGLVLLPPHVVDDELLQVRRLKQIRYGQWVDSILWDVI